MSFNFQRTAIGLLSILATACATSPTGRKQLMLVPDSQMDAMGAEAFTQLKQSTPVVSDPTYTNYVKCVVTPILDAAKGRTDTDQWEIVVFKDDTANAFALPGGKIGVHTGILPVAKTDAQLAAVLGHEVGHVIAKHGAERVSEQVVEQGGLSLIEGFLGGQSSSATNQLIMSALGMGTQVGIALPHSRTQESEADLIGLDLMANAGYDPEQSIELWKNMSAKAGSGAPPEWLSTHPADQTRIGNLQAHMGPAEEAYKKAKAAGRHPVCQRPSGK